MSDFNTTLAAYVPERDAVEDLKKSKITEKQMWRSKHKLLRYWDRKLLIRDTCVQAHLPVIQNHIHTVAGHHTVDTETIPSHMLLDGPGIGGAPSESIVFDKKNEKEYS